MSNNCYLLRCVSTGDQVLIDAAAEPDTLLPLVGDAGLDPRGHDPPALGPPPRAAPRWSRRPGPTVVAGAPDAEAITEQTGVAVDPGVEDGDTVPVGDLHAAR